MAAQLEPRKLEVPRGAALARLLRTRRRWPRPSGVLSAYPPLVFAGRGARAQGASSPKSAPARVPAAGRRLRRELRRVPSEQHPRHLPRAAADGGGADLRQQAAGGEGRAHGRASSPSRARSPTETSRRRHAAELPRRQRQRASSSRPEARRNDPRADDARVFREAAATLNLLRAFADRRLRQLAPGAPLDARFHGPQPVGRPLHATSPTASAKRSTSWKPAGSIRRRCRSSRPPASTPATRRCCCLTSRRWRGRIR